MPSGTAVMTKKERIIAREEAEPVVNKVRELLLRAGARGVVEYQQALTAAHTAAQRASTSATTSTYRTSPPPPPSTATSSALTSPRESAPAKLRRLNPEDLKSATRDAGVLLSPAEYKKLLLAFTDTVGFVLIDTYLATLSQPTSPAAEAYETTILAAFPGSPSRASLTVETEGESFMALPNLTLASLLDLCVLLFAPLESTQSDTASGEALSVEENNTNAQLQLAYEDAADTFTQAHYPTGHVPGQDVLAYVLALLQLSAGRQRCVDVVSQRLRSASGVLEASSTAASVTSAPSGVVAAPTTFSMTHTGVRTQRKFEYYQEEDRRDEWIRGRDEKDAQKGYQRHVVGYGGHLPEYQYHFGRTFHVIEEDLPLLSKPKPPLEPVPADAYGPKRELKESRMNAHHYRLA